MAPLDLSKSVCSSGISKQNNETLEDYPGVVVLGVVSVDTRFMN